MEDMSQSKEAVKEDNYQLNQKIIQLEQEIFESKTVGLELIDQLKKCEQDLFEVTERKDKYKSKVAQMQEIIVKLEKN